MLLLVATVLTVYGIETCSSIYSHVFKFLQLQQYLPFTVLKLNHYSMGQDFHKPQLQQYLPFTVLKLDGREMFDIIIAIPKVLQQYLPFTVLKL